MRGEARNSRSFGHPFFLSERKIVVGNVGNVAESLALIVRERNGLFSLCGNAACGGGVGASFSELNFFDDNFRRTLVFAFLVLPVINLNGTESDDRGTFSEKLGNKFCGLSESDAIDEVRLVSLHPARYGNGEPDNGNVAVSAYSEFGVGGEPSHKEYFIDIHNSGLLSVSFIFSFVLLLNDHGTKYARRDVENAVELSGYFRVSLEVDENVIAFGLIIDGISKSALAPYVYILDDSAVFRDEILKLLGRRFKCGIVERFGAQYEQTFILSHSETPPSGLTENGHLAVFKGLTGGISTYT